MDAALSALRKLEVLDGIGDVNAPAVEAGFRQGAIKKLTGRTYERPALPVLLIAGLLANECRWSADWSFSCRRP
jgi:hypothetical protein